AAVAGEAFESVGEVEFFGDAIPQVPVFDDGEIEIEIADVVDDRAADHDAGGLHGHVAEDALEGAMEEAFISAADAHVAGFPDAVLAVDDVDSAEGEAGGGEFFEEAHEGGAELREPEVVGVEEGEERAGGELHADVAGFGGAAVLLAVEDEFDALLA